MSVHIKKSRALAAVSLTPLIDVVFLLLIFFLVATRFAEEDRELDVQLPDASEAQPMTLEPETMFIGINKAGQYHVDGKRVELAELEAIVRRAVRDNPVNQTVIVRADRSVPLQYPVNVVNLCKKLGIPDPTLTIEGTDPAL